MTDPMADQARVRHALPVLMYHSVAEVTGPLAPFGVPANRLRAQLDALATAGYRMVGQTRALRELDGPGTGPSVALTFDDGYADFLYSGLSVLADVGATATLYAPVEHLGGPATWLGRRAGDFGRLLTAAELAEVSAAGIEIGSHGMVHHWLDVLPADQVTLEVTRSREILADIVARPVTSFCYPYGYHDARVRRAVRQAGYHNACAVDRRRCVPGDDLFAVPRLHVTPDMDGRRLVELVRSGETGLIRRLGRMAQPGWRTARRLAHRTRLAGQL